KVDHKAEMSIRAFIDRWMASPWARTHTIHDLYGDSKEYVEGRVHRSSTTLKARLSELDKAIVPKVSQAGQKQVTEDNQKRALARCLVKMGYQDYVRDMAKRAGSAAQR